MGFGLGSIGDAIGGVGDSISDAYSDVKDSVSDFIDDPIDFVKDNGLTLLNPNIGLLKNGYDWLIDELTDIPINNIDREKGVLLNTQSTVEKIPVVYGTRKVGAIRVFWGSAGDTNQDLHVVLVLCEGEIDSVPEIYIDDIISTDERFTGLLDIRVYTGTTTQTVDSVLNVAFPTQWGIDKLLSGVAYLACKFTMGENSPYSSFPRVTAVVKGKKVFDPRDVGQSYADPSTWLYSENPAWQIRDYLKNNIYGRGLADSAINDTAFIAAADYYDTPSPLFIGSVDTEALLATNIVVDTGNKVFDNIGALVGSCRSKLPFIQGAYTLTPLRDEPTDVYFNEDNIFGAVVYKSPNKSSLLNTVEVRYINPGDNWQPATVQDQSVAYLAEDNGLELDTTVDFSGETSPYRARYRAEYLLKTSRNTGIVTFNAGPEALKLNPTSVFALSYDSYGFVDKLFRVVEMALTLTGRIRITGIEYDPADYDRTVTSEYLPPSDTILVTPFVIDPPTNLNVISDESQLVLGRDGTLIVMVRVLWTASQNPFVVAYSIEYKESASATWLPGAAVNNPALTEGLIPNLREGVLHDFRVKAIGGQGVSSSYAYLYGATVVGKTSPPPDVQAFFFSAQGDGTRQFTWQYPSPPLDLDGFSVRYYAGAGGTWEQMTPISGAEKLSDGLRAWETNQLAQGHYTIGIKAVDTSGNYSTNAIIIEGDLPNPRIAASFEIVNLPTVGWPGLRFNCTVYPDRSELYADDQSHWQDWAQWQGLTFWNKNPYPDLHYVHTFDIGAIVTLTPLVSVVHNADTLIIEEEHSDDGVTYTPWAVVGPPLTCRYIRIRISAFKLSGVIVISNADIILSGDTVNEILEDIDTSLLIAPYRLGVGDIRVPITQVYTKIKRVNVIFQNTGPGWSYEVIDKDVAIGPRIKLYNASLALADANIDVDIVGV